MEGPRGGASNPEDEFPTPGKLTPKQAAARSGMSPSLVYLLCEQRLLPHYRVGSRGRRGKILIDARELDRFMEGARVEAAAPPPPAPRAGAFKNLDASRLLESWRGAGEA